MSRPSSVPGVHEPVMMAEVVEYLSPSAKGIFLDCTAGGGGHSRALLEAGAGRVLGLDRDAEALPIAEATLSGWSDRIELVHANFCEVETVLDVRGISTVEGAVADLGMSTLQLETPGRGFSFRREGPLDMRMDRSKGPTAAELLRDVSEQSLANLIFQYGEERYSRRIARAIVDRRALRPIVTTGELATIVRRVVPSRGRPRIDSSTRTFQAVRIWVNQELEHLDRFLRSVCRRLQTGARFAVITFHSLEDRIVKTVFRELGSQPGRSVRLLTKRPTRPTWDEVARNPRARSAKLRAAERLA